MAVTLTGSNGLFTRLGKLAQVGEIILDVQQPKGESGGLEDWLEAVVAEFDSADMRYVERILDPIPLQRMAARGLYNLRLAAQSILIGMVDDDVTLADRSVRGALLELIDQMESSADSINGWTPSSGVLAGSDSDNVGDGEIDVDIITLGPSQDHVENHGLNQHTRAEDGYLLCVADSQNGVTQAGQELWTYTTEPVISDIADPRWPGGTGISGAVIRTIDPSEDAQAAPGRNKLTNSDFEDFTTADTPDNWTIVTGAAGTDFLEENTIVHRGSSSLSLVGDGSTLHDIHHALATNLKPNTFYAFGCAVRSSSTFTGNVRMDIVDASDNSLVPTIGATLAQDTITTGVSDSWAYSNHKFFRTGYSVPQSVRARVYAFSTPIGNTHILYIDSMYLIEMPFLGTPACVHVGIRPGETDYNVNDKATIRTTAYTRANNDWLWWMDKFFDMYGMGLQLPHDTASSETVLDSLIS